MSSSTSRSKRGRSTQERGKVHMTEIRSECGVRAKFNVPPQLRSQHAVQCSTPPRPTEEAAITKGQGTTRVLCTAPASRVNGAQIKDRLVSSF